MIWVLERIIKVNELNDNDVFKGVIDTPQAFKNQIHIYNRNGWIELFTNLKGMHKMA